MKFIACYIRVSAIAPDLGQQRREMNRWLKGNRVNPASVRWYIDKATNDPRHRPRRAALQADIAHNQVRGVIVWNLDKLAETTRDGLKLLVDWCTKSLRVVSVSQEIDIKGADCAMVAPILRGIADMDDQTRRERSRAGLATARARGRAGGRPRMAADDAKVLRAKELQKNHSLSIDEICRKLEVSRSTYYRHVAK